MTVTPIAARRMVVCALLLFGCGGGTEPSQSRKPAFVSVSSDVGGALPGTSVQFAATAIDSAGQPIAGTSFEWDTEDPFLATVDANGLVTAHHPGPVLIFARTAGLEGGLTLNVLEPVASVLLGGVRAPLVPGAMFRLPYTLRSAVGDSLDIGFRLLGWSSSQQSVAQVSSDGIVTTIAPGTTTLTLTATGEGVSASVDLSVTTLQYLTAQDGGPLTCGLTVAKRIYCWGTYYTGLQPDGVELLGVTPWPLETDVLFDSLRVGGGVGCALTAAGEPWCWGTNENGTLGDGTFTSRLTPAPVSGGLILKSIVPGAGYTCGLLLDGAARCWGANDWGALGTGDRESSLVPRESAAGIQFRTISLSPTVQSGGPHTCGMSLGGVAYCWGANEFGQLATYPRTQISESPTQVLSPTPLMDVQSGGQHGCGLTAAAAVLCWGDNQNSSLGDRQLQYPNIDSIPAPVPNAPAFTQVRAGLYRTCGLTGAGAVYCWGDNFGATPVQIQIPQALTRIDVSVGRFCGMSVQGVAWCWTTPASAATKAEGQS
jgi:Regulator of Chromosome Condensation (RCC1) repeat protein/regulator of chromosome condensation (RCC1) repeat-containing protein/Big-like domain-containing protein